MTAGADVAGPGAGPARDRRPIPPRRRRRRAPRAARWSPPTSAGGRRDRTPAEPRPRGARPRRARAGRPAVGHPAVLRHPRDDGRRHQPRGGGARLRHARADRRGRRPIAPQRPDPLHLELRHDRAAAGARRPSRAPLRRRVRPGDRAADHGRRLGGRRPRAAGDLRPRRRGDPPRAVVRRLRPGRSCSPAASSVHVATRVEDDFALDPAAVEAAITPRTKALFLGYPCNPTGAVLPDDVQDELADIAERHDLLVYSDEIYDRLAYGSYRHRAFSALPGMRDRTILMGGFSKAYAMTGWRVGWLAAPAAILEGIVKVHQYGIMSAADDGPGRGARGARSTARRTSSGWSRSTTAAGGSSSTASTRSGSGRSSRAARSTRSPRSPPRPA